MKARTIAVGLIILAAALAVIAYTANTVQGRAIPMQSGGGSDGLRWHVVTNPGDSSKTFLIDSLVGETYILAASGDAHSWKKMERGK